MPVFNIMNPHLHGMNVLFETGKTSMVLVELSKGFACLLLYVLLCVQ